MLRAAQDRENSRWGHRAGKGSAGLGGGGGETAAPPAPRPRSAPAVTSEPDPLNRAAAAAGCWAEIATLSRLDGRIPQRPGQAAASTPR